jgi:uncharacterized protein (DUF305 family)
MIHHSLGPGARVPLAVLLLIATAGCSGASPEADLAETGSESMSHDWMSGEGMSAEVVIPDGVLHTAADVRFMQGMIAHHAQAIYMTQLAAVQGADSRVLTLAKKIDQSQAAEIGLMQGWLYEKDQFAPDTTSHRTIMMPGMLTAEQLEQLAAANGNDFDRLFLELMIQHHGGAIQMVADLLAAPRAAQDVDINVFANEVHLVQTIEIEIMLEMLTDLPTESPFDA